MDFIVVQAFRLRQDAGEIVVQASRLRQDAGEIVVQASRLRQDAGETPAPQGTSRSPHCSAANDCRRTDIPVCRK